jgi:DNA replication licensing factor MCM7
VSFPPAARVLMRSLPDTAPEGFESFLRDFKCSPQDAITQALGDINIDEDDLSDEYDFMDDDEEAQQRRAQEKARKRAPQHKYKEILQNVADRKIQEVVIDLDDLATVRHT